MAHDAGPGFGLDGEGEGGAEGVGRPHEVAKVHGLGNAFGSDAEIAAHGLSPLRNEV